MSATAARSRTYATPVMKPPAPAADAAIASAVVVAAPPVAAPELAGAANASSPLEEVD